MRKITIVYDQSHYLYRWLKPMFVAKKEFQSLGYKIEYSCFSDYFPIFQGDRMIAQEKKIIRRAMNTKRDIVMLAFHHSTSYLGKCSQEERCQILSKIKKNCNMLIWMDTADSTGTCLFDVMPNVDLYFKKQILKNREDYCGNIWGNRTFCEFYHNLLGLDDKTITQCLYSVLERKYLYKLRISWNIGIGDLFANPYQLLLKPFSITKPKFVNPDSYKPLDIQYRGSGYSPIAGYPRTRSKELLREIEGVSCSDIDKKIPHKKYVLEGHMAKAILSPFGWGEICGRDFESFVYGATMIKQSMEHLDTYPNIYQPDVTYVSLDWDFSDFKEKISKVASNNYKDIAKFGQLCYLHYFTKKARKEFAEHFVNELERV